MNNKKIAVIGLGGVGGYIGALLADKYEDVTFVVRNQRKECIEKNGLLLKSDYRGERHIKNAKVVQNIKEAEKPDYIFVCVKNYSLDKVCDDLAECVTEDTVIVPVMNGVDPGDRIRKRLAKGTVVDTLIYIVSYVDSEGNIRQEGDFARICAGIQNASDKEKDIAKEVSMLLDAAGADCEVYEDIHREIWKKYILNAAYNVETAFYDNCIGELRDDVLKAKQYEMLVYEALKIGMVKGICLDEEDAKSVIDKFYKYDYSATSSLQRDYQAKKTLTEIETFCGYLLKEAKKYNIVLPVTEYMYKGLKK